MSKMSLYALIVKCPHHGHSVGWTVMTETIVLYIYSVKTQFWFEWYDYKERIKSPFMCYIRPE